MTRSRTVLLGIIACIFIGIDIALLLTYGLTHAQPALVGALLINFAVSATIAAILLVQRAQHSSSG